MTTEFLPPERPLLSAALRALPAGLVVLLLPELDAAAVGGYLWLAVVGTLLAYALWFQGVGRLPVAAVSFLVLLSPVVATVLGWLVLGQPLTALQSVGFAVAIASILGAQLAPPAPRASSMDEGPLVTGRAG